MVPVEELSENDRELVDQCNKLLFDFNIPLQVRNVEDIGATVFVTLFEHLQGEQLPEIIRKPVTREDEIHNCQAVIDSLSKDVLHISLSHIRATEIISYAREDIAHLLEIFHGLSEYILARIDTDGSENGDGCSVGESTDMLNDPDLVTPRLIDDILNEELLKDGGDMQRKSVSPSTRNKTDYINNYLQSTVDQKNTLPFNHIEKFGEVIMAEEITTFV